MTLADSTTGSASCPQRQLPWPPDLRMSELGEWAGSRGRGRLGGKVSPFWEEKKLKKVQEEPECRVLQLRALGPPGIRGPSLREARSPEQP